MMLINTKNCSSEKGIYISGKMSGIENYNYDGFKNAENRLKIILPNKIIINPMNFILEMYSMEELLNNQYDYNFILSKVLEILKTKCNAIYMLKNWHQSNGSKEEMKIALSLHYLIYFE